MIAEDGSIFSPEDLRQSFDKSSRKLVPYVLYLRVTISVISRVFHLPKSSPRASSSRLETRSLPLTFDSRAGWAVPIRFDIRRRLRLFRNLRTPCCQRLNRVVHRSSIRCRRFACSPNKYLNASHALITRNAFALQSQITL
jgi:hypothetical protein